MDKDAGERAVSGKWVRTYSLLYRTLEADLRGSGLSCRSLAHILLFKRPEPELKSLCPE